VTAQFHGPLVVQHDGRLWRVMQPLVYDSVVARRTIVVPAAFIFDGASVPRLPFAFWLTGGRALAPACLHDYGYQHPAEEDRGLWDAIFREAMGVRQPELGYHGERWWVRGLMYGAVRTCGWLAWRRYEKRGRELNPIWTASAWPQQEEPPGGT